MSYLARRPRRSKNRTPARAGAAASELTSAIVTEIPGRSSDNQRLAKAAEASPTIVEFLQQLRAYIVQECARGKEIDQIFDDLEGSYGRLEKALRKRSAGADRSRSVTASGWPLTQDEEGGSGQQGARAQGPRSPPARSFRRS